MSTVSRSAFFNAVEGLQQSGLVRVQSTSPLLSSPPPPSSTSDDSISRADLPLPLVLVPTSPQSMALKDATDWVSSVQSHLEVLLAMTGCLFFRHFPTPLATDFAEFVEAFKGWEDLPYEDSLSYAVRLRVCRRVCTTNEGKRGGLVFHHELAQAKTWPSKLLFYCELKAEQGGGTAVTPSWKVLEELKKSFPSFVAQCQEKGVVYRSVFPPEPDTTKGVGRSWKSFFGRNTRAEVKVRMEELGYSGTWDEADCLHLTSPLLPAIRVTADHTEVFFNQMIAQHLANAREFSDAGNGAVKESGGRSVTTRLDDFIRFGDGSAVDGAALDFAKAVSERFAVELEWQNGDIALIDNMLLMHARREFEGPRRVFASLVQ